jgi:predicted nicotinamide N-methyase
MSVMGEGTETNRKGNITRRVSKDCEDVNFTNQDSMNSSGSSHSSSRTTCYSPNQSDESKNISAVEKTTSEVCDDDNDVGFFDPDLFTSHIELERSDFTFGKTNEIRVSLFCVHDYYQLMAKFVAKTVWPSALALCLFFSDHPELVKGARILELGSGTGLCGITLAVIGAKHVALTDYNESAVELLNKNIVLNNVQENCSAHLLTWGDKVAADEIVRETGGSLFDIVVGTDVVYDSACINPLLSSATHLKLGETGKFYLANHSCRYLALETEVQAAAMELDLTETKMPDKILEKDGCVAMSMFT